jgi:hypothetical protein
MKLNLKCNGFRAETCRLLTIYRHLLETKTYRANSSRVGFKLRTIGHKSKKMRTLLTTTNKRATTPLWISSISTTKTRSKSRSLSAHSRQAPTPEFKYRKTPTSANGLHFQYKSWTTPRNRKTASRASCSKTAPLTKKCTRRDLTNNHYSQTNFQHPTALTLTLITLAGKLDKVPTPSWKKAPTNLRANA